MPLPMSTPMPVTWLHVSDFHIREGDPYDRNVVLSALVSSVRRMRHRSGAMLVSGEVGVPPRQWRERSALQRVRGTLAVDDG
jgi:hypothetical protein